MSAVQALLQQFAPLPFSDAAADAAAHIRAGLMASGFSIGPGDLQIAAIAHVHRLTLVTHNVADFNRIPSLPLDDWQIE